MKSSSVAGAESLCAALEQLNVSTVFGLPGSATIPLYEAMRRSNLRTVLSTSEQAAAFSAIGYFRAGSRIAAVTAIHGPGFTQVLSGLAEALYDSVPLLFLVTNPTANPENKFRLQALDQKQMALPVVKKIFEISNVSQLASSISDAFRFATIGEPGPVMVQIDDSVLTDLCSLPRIESATVSGQIDEYTIKTVVEKLVSARKPILFCGQGAANFTEQIQQLAQHCSLPVITTGSGRGVIAEDHQYSLCADLRGSAWTELNALLDEADFVLAVGCKFSHSGSAGFRLNISPDKLIHVDSSAEVLGANYQANRLIEASAGDFLTKLLSTCLTIASLSSEWNLESVETWRNRLAEEMESSLPYVPVLESNNSTSLADVFRALRDTFPRNTIMVTDSGYHQVIARTIWRVFSARGLIAPSDFQSMGFALPAAIGAALAEPHRHVVAVVGDGGLNMSGMELLTAVREEVSMTIILVRDGSLGQIRLEQLEAYGTDHDTRLISPDIACWCGSMGVNHVLLEGNVNSLAREVADSSAITLVEVPTNGGVALRRISVKGWAIGKTKRYLGPRIVATLKKLLGRK